MLSEGIQPHAQGSQFIWLLGLAVVHYDSAHPLRYTADFHTHRPDCPGECQRSQPNH
jgi:hypothetical protein